MIHKIGSTVEEPVTPPYTEWPPPILTARFNRLTFLVPPKLGLHPQDTSRRAKTIRQDPAAATPAGLMLVL